MNNAARLGRAQKKKGSNNDVPVGWSSPIEFWNYHLTRRCRRARLNGWPRRRPERSSVLFYSSSEESTQLKIDISERDDFGSTSGRVARLGQPCSLKPVVARREETLR